MEAYSLPPSDDELLAECDVQTFRSHGKGGQSVNTADSAVRLRHRPTGIVVVCRRQRSQLLNKRDCLGRLRERITEAQREAPERVPTSEPPGVKRSVRESKERVARKKRLRARPPAEEDE